MYASRARLVDSSRTLYSASCRTGYPQILLCTSLLQSIGVVMLLAQFLVLEEPAYMGCWSW